MNSKLTLVLTTALLLFVGGGERMAYAGVRPDRMTGTLQDKSIQSQSDRTNAAPANDCSLLTPAMLKKVLGQSELGKPEAQKVPPMYGGAWGWNCTYYLGYQNHGGVKVEFSVYTEESAAKAKQDFDTYAIAADDSRGKPSIGDAAYWVEPGTSKRVTDNSKKTLLIFVLKGKVHFNLQLTPTNDKQLADLAAAVAAGI
jgi:hypothetical protein